MAATEYDQIDNEYKPVASAKQIEQARDREMNEGAQQVQEQKEYERELARAQREAEIEKDQEILKRQEEQRELRRKKREEQEAEAIERKRDADMAEGSRKTYHVEQRRIRSENRESQRIEQKRDVDMGEGAKEILSSPSRLKAIGNVNEAFDTFRGQDTTIGGIKFEGAGTRQKKAVKEYEREKAHETPFGGMLFDIKEKIGADIQKSKTSAKATQDFFTTPGLTGRLTLGAQKGLVKYGGIAKQTAVKHIKQSWNDQFLQPLNPYDKEKNPTGVKRMQKTPAKPMPSMFGRGKAPTGLLDLGSFASKPASLFVLGKKTAATTKKKGSKDKKTKSTPRVQAPRRNLLDDELGFF